jgi:hypothetical protein
MEGNLILKIRWNNPVFTKLFQHYRDFLIQVYHKLGCEIYIENVLDGALVFYKTITDFMNFHKLADTFFIPVPARAAISRNKNGHVELFVELVKIPPNVKIDDLMPGVIESYQIVSKDIKVERLSETSAVVHYGDALNVEAILEMLMKFWDETRGDITVNAPKRREIPKLFENLPK